MPQGIAVGCAGRARVGKGSFVTLLTNILHGIHNVAPFAFATELKRELDPILRAKYGISAFTQDTAEKVIIRPDLVARGAGARAEDPNHWIKIIEPEVLKVLARGDVAIIEDVRYLNEAKWVQSLGGKVVYIERLLPGSTTEIVPFANSEEADNDPKARVVADLVVRWPTFPQNPLDHMRPFVLNAWSQLTSQSPTP